MFEDDDFSDEDDERPISDDEYRVRYIDKWCPEAWVAWDEELLQVPKSLKDNCLDCITKKFETFNYAYLSSDDSALRRNLEFLQRVYSSQVIDILSTKELLRDRHLDFLINEFLKELDTGILLNRCSLKAIEKRIVLVGNGFTKVSFHFPCLLDGITEFLNAVICHLSNVEVLRIPAHCDDKTLKDISSFCTKLSELNIDGSCNVTSEGLKMLCKRRGEDQTECLIKILSIECIDVLGSAINFLLNNMPHLEVLNCDNLPNILHYIHKEDLKNNTLNSAKKYNLTNLHFFNSSEFSDTEQYSKSEILQVWTEVCPNIKTVFIDISTKDCLDLISRFANLENFIAYSDERIEIHIIELNNFLKSNGIKLRKLMIEGFALSVPILIESCSNLQKLALTNVQFQSLEKNHTKEQPSNKKSLLSLSELDLVDITFSDQHAEDSVSHVLRSSPNLRKLNFVTCKFENCEMNTKLAKFCEDICVQHLEFFECDADIALFESIILTCSSLRTLTIEICEKIRWKEAFNLQQLKDTVRSGVTIVYNKS